MTSPAPTVPGAVLISSPTGSELVSIIAGGPIQQVTTLQDVANLAPGGASGANPTATAGAAAINGTSTHFMRADAAPAIAKASSSVFGIVEVDNVSIKSTAGVIATNGVSAGPFTAISSITVVNGIITAITGT